MLPMDLTGIKYGRLTAIKRVGVNNSGNATWLCVCECGQQTSVGSNNLRSGHTKSCGCLGRELRLRHGHNRRGKTTKAYTAWHGMIQRCTNNKSRKYDSYGGRGILVCDRWLVFENFISDMGNPPTGNCSIDRVDNNGDYCPENCRWATIKQQARNTRRNRLLTFSNKTQCLAAWAEEYGIKSSVLWSRLFRCGWPMGRALTEPVWNRGENA